MTDLNRNTLGTLLDNTCPVPIVGFHPRVEFSLLARIHLTAQSISLKLVRMAVAPKFTVVGPSRWRLQEAGGTQGVSG